VETTADGRESSLGIRRALGLTHVAYHIAITPGGGLSQHHAQHAGVALAHQHARALRDGQELRAKFPQCQELIEEFVIADHLGLSSAAGLLAAHIANKTGRRLDPDQADSPRRALLALAKGT
jgi:hypothetical protein